MVALMVVSAVLHLGPLFITILFSCLILRTLNLTGKKRLAILLYILIISLLIYGITWFGHQSLVTLPKIADKAIPTIADWAERQGKDVEFLKDWSSLRAEALKAMTQSTEYLRNAAVFAQDTLRLLVQMLIGVVVAMSIFLNSKINLDKDEPDSLYGLCSQEVAARVNTFFQSFATVMGAQVVISLINTVLTGIFITLVGLPHNLILVGVTFLCGMLPVVGNLISNIVIVTVAFTVSPTMAGWSLLFLVVVHKLEYFLNSKIVGDRIRNPIWLTMLGLMVGELTMGIPGMILAPVFLHYLKVEASKIHLPKAEADESPGWADDD
jgi:predicted PurR-regulated permease PerM